MHKYVVVKFAGPPFMEKYTYEELTAGNTRFGGDPVITPVPPTLAAYATDKSNILRRLSPAALKEFWRSPVCWWCSRSDG